MSQQKTSNLKVIQENVVTDPTFFSKFRLRGPTLTRNFANFLSKFQSCNLQLITFQKRYLDAKYRFRKVISCKKHDWNFYLKFAKFRVKVGPRSRNLLKKVGSVTTFSWITLKFSVFCWDKYYFSESLGSKLTEIMMNYKTFHYFFKKS